MSLDQRNKTLAEFARYTGRIMPAACFQNTVRTPRPYDVDPYSAAIASAISPSTPERAPSPGSRINYLAAVHFIDAA
jgi:hypothetical protein